MPCAGLASRIVDEDEMFQALRAHRLALCDQLEGLTDEQWNATSLCGGWRVRDVLGHLVSVQVVPTWKFMLGVYSMKSFDRRADKIAREFGARSPQSLVDQYRSLAESKRGAPFVGLMAPLADVLTHSVDIQRPLGLPDVHASSAAETVLTRLAAGLQGFTSKKAARRLRLEATDLACQVGEGSDVQGLVSDLLLALNGRPAGFDALVGDGAATLRSRVLG